MNLSVFFRSAAGEEHFLFQCLNRDRAEDDFKFVFTNPSSGIGATFQVSADRYGQEDLIRPVPEITYHPSGSLFFKLPLKGHPDEYRNPQRKDFKRTPLDSIGSWEGFLVYRVHRYDLCRKKAASNRMLLEIDPDWFDGTAFEARFFLGLKSCPTPIESDSILVQRVSTISLRLDLLLMFKKISTTGFRAQLGNSSASVFSRNNVVEVIPHVGKERAVRS